MRRCYRWWSLKNAIPKLWAIGLERFGMPILHGKASDNRTKKELNEALENLASRSYITTDKESEINSIFSPSSSISQGYKLAEELCDKMIYKAIFLPSLLGAGEEGGSYSLGQVHYELFNSTAASLAEDYIDMELEQLWRPLIEWNFGEQDNYGDFLVTDTMSSAEKLTLSTVMSNLAQVGIVDPESDRAWVRELLKLPDVEEGAVFPRWQLENQKDEDSETS